MTDKTPTLVHEMDPKATYTVDIIFRSVGDGNQVVPDISYSHRFADDYDGDYPASYLLARDVLMMLNVMNTMQHVNEEIDPENDGFLSIDELADAANDADNGDGTVH